MSTPHAKVRLALVLAGALAVLAVAGAAVTRWALLPWAVESALRAGGASEVKFQVERATPWRLQLTDLGFNFDTMKFGARRASLERSHWWAASLGKLNVEGAQVEVDLAKASAVGAAAPANASPASGPNIPLEEISIDGRLTIQAGDDIKQTLAVDFLARPVVDGSWQGGVTVTAPGLNLALDATYRPETQEAAFQTTAFRVELRPWQAWLEHWAPLPGGPWELDGTLSGTASGAYRNSAFTAAGDFTLRAGKVVNPGMGFTAEGVEADIAVHDLTHLLARKVELRATRLTSGKILLSDITAEFARTESGRVDVASVSAQALGGAVSLEPFRYQLGDAGVEVVVLAKGIMAEEVLALTQAVPAQARGPLSGRVPLHYDGNLRFGTGWLATEPGTAVEIAFQAQGLLTAGQSPKSVNYAVLKQLEDGIMKLRATEVRLEIRPPDAPANRTARLRIVGSPVDPRVKAPVTLDVNVNGQVESFLNLGMKSGMGFGTKP